jgi:hypothetical protein
VPPVVAPVALAGVLTAAATAALVQAGMATAIDFSWDPHLLAPHGGVPGPITVHRDMPPRVCMWILDLLERPTRVPEYSPLGGLLDENELRECAIELERMHHKDHGAPQGRDSMSNVPAALQVQLIQLGCTKARCDWHITIAPTFKAVDKQRAFELYYNQHTGTNLQSILDVIQTWHRSWLDSVSPLKRNAPAPLRLDIPVAAVARWPEAAPNSNDNEDDGARGKAAGPTGKTDPNKHGGGTSSSEPSHSGAPHGRLRSHAQSAPAPLGILSGPPIVTPAIARCL